MPRVGIEPTISVFETAKTVHVLDRAATVIGQLFTLSVDKVLCLYIGNGSFRPRAS
jgi:hypothetical protein